MTLADACLPLIAGRRLATPEIIWAGTVAVKRIVHLMQLFLLTTAKSPVYWYVWARMGAINAHLEVQQLIGLGAA